MARRLLAEEPCATKRSRLVGQRRRLQSRSREVEKARGRYEPGSLRAGPKREGSADLSSDTSGGHRPQRVPPGPVGGSSAGARHLDGLEILEASLKARTTYCL